MLLPATYADLPADSIRLELPETGKFLDMALPMPAAEQRTESADDSDLCDGWPVDLSSPGAGFPYTPTLFDLNGNGADEIFVTGGETFGINGDGSFLSGWPTAEMAYMGYGTNDQMPGPSCADMEGNGSVEILWSLRDWNAGSAHYWSFNGRNSNGSNMAGFPQTAPDESSNALDIPFVLGDADGDGNLEAWTGHTLGNTGDYYRLTAFDHLGNLTFTTDLDPDENILNLFFGDADGNGSDEFFAITLLSGEFRLHLFTSAGAEQPGYPKVLFSPGSGYLMFGPPIATDLDADGDLEMILGHYASTVSYASAYHHDGAIVDGFPITVATSSQLFYLGLGDVTADGDPELIAVDNHLGSDYRVHVIDIATGLPLAGWPVPQSNWPEGFPTIVDVNDDGTQDVCFVTDGGELFALSRDGSIIADYPKVMSSPSISGVSAGDIDGDGLYELVAATWDGFVYAWDTDGTVGPDRADWPMRGVDARNTGVFRGSGSTGIGSVDTSGLRFAPASNPARGSVEFLLPELPSATLDIFDLSGRRMASLNAAGVESIRWFPVDAIPAGAYIAQLTGTDGESWTTGLILLR